MPLAIPIRSAPAGGAGLTHGQPFTVTGSGFGTSNTVVVVRDTGQDGAGVLNAAWTGSAPKALTGNNNIQNQNVNFSGSGASIGAPHAYVSCIVAGCHLDTGNPSNNVELFVAYTIPAFPYPQWASWYTRIDPNWVYGAGSPADDNLKYVNWGHGNHGEGELPSDGQFYFAFNPPGPTSASVVTKSTVDNATPAASQHFMEEPDFNGHSRFWDAKYHPGHAANGWIKEEYAACITTATGNSGGYWFEWSTAEGAAVLQVCSYVGSTDTLLLDSDAKRSMTWGSYARSRSASNFRYGGDYFIAYGGTGDAACAMVFLANTNSWNTATVREAQVATAWADGSITSTCHRGKLSAGPVYALIQPRNTKAGTGIIVRGPFTMT